MKINIKPLTNVVKELLAGPRGTTLTLLVWALSNMNSFPCTFNLTWTGLFCTDSNNLLALHLWDEKLHEVVERFLT